MSTTPEWNLLVVDNDEDDFILIKDMFQNIERKKCRVVWAPGPKEGLTLIQSDAWHAALVDYDLGATNGLDFIRSVKSTGFKQPLIMVTGRGSYELDLEATAAGATDYISKNVLSSILLERVVRHAIERMQIEEYLQMMVDKRTEELQTLLEEFSVMNEELSAQNESFMLAQSNKTTEFDLYRERQSTFPTAYVVTDRSAKIIKCDYGAALMFGMSPERLVGHQLSLFIAITERAQFVHHLFTLSPAHPTRHWGAHLLDRRFSAFDCYFTVYYIDNCEDCDQNGPQLRWLIQPNPDISLKRDSNYVKTF